MTIAQRLEQCGLEKGREQGKLEGKLKGIEEGKLAQAFEIARNLLEKGLALDFVKEITHLSGEELFHVQRRVQQDMSSVMDPATPSIMSTNESTLFLGQEPERLCPNGCCPGFWHEPKGL